MAWGKAASAESFVPLSPVISMHPTDNHISTEEINQLPLAELHDQVFVANTVPLAEEALALLRPMTVLGFDTETRPNFHKGPMSPPSLLQLAGEGLVVIFQLENIPEWSGWCELLASPAIKAGVAVADDIKGLRKRNERFEPSGFVDLGTLARQKGMAEAGLRPLVAKLFGVRVPKGMRTSNWAARMLNDSQVRYAALDAALSRDIYRELSALPDVPDNARPPRHTHRGSSAGRAQ